MIIAVDARVLSRKLTGIGYYLKNILIQLLKLDTENTYILFSDGEIPFFDNYKNLKKIIKKSIFKLPGTLWLHTQGLKEIKKQHPDIYWGPANIIPFNLPDTYKIVTVHDLVWHYYPSTMFWFNRLVGSILCKFSINKSDLVVSVSNTTADDTKKLFNPKNILVTPNGVSKSFQNCRIDDTDSKNLTNKFGISSNYILAVSTLEPRKNLSSLVEAFDIYCTKFHPDEDLQLVIVGASGWKNSHLNKIVARLPNKNKVKFLGYVEDHELPTIYNKAQALISTSLYEGFGLPLLESMASGTPVICSSIKIYDEVTGDAAYKVPPLKPADIAKGINSVLTNKDLRENLISAGLNRSKNFSWENSAKKLFQVIKGIKNDS